MMAHSSVEPLLEAYALRGAQCREARERREREMRERGKRERQKGLHTPFALHFPIQWAIQGCVIMEASKSLTLCPTPRHKSVTAGTFLGAIQVSGRSSQSP